MNLLLQEWKLWDCDILMRSALECATRFLFVAVANNPERSQRIEEYTTSLNEIEDILRSEKAKTAAVNADDDHDAMLLGGAALSPDKEAELRSKWPQSKRKALKQKWSFSEIVRVLERVNYPTLNLTKYGSLLHSYGLSSHLIHADQTAMNLMRDRATRTAEERRLLEQAHFARLAVEPTTLLFICWRAMEHAIESTTKHISLVEAMFELLEEGRQYHEEFAISQMHLYEGVTPTNPP
ncbi:DUF5677 domain-containing protein [Dyella nitratireducens]|uniref:Uncharacterized protein n=1 Tax=Dyella nitratireducens TaxID=1849580 RepID=A0ABQ1FLP3_9GAMM|nr:DUF5677 domain-containing protein [Dyella nitratireducens]GGA19315.1 hypothetical protein GCM10010981_04130 [Dyella nitratireducens]GLQ44526.1 hypothetical protein GCM10007902_43760 [Dyella nitratireducens]